MRKPRSKNVFLHLALVAALMTACGAQEEATPDAGPPDAGAVDAGSAVDAGPDAGPPRPPPRIFAKRLVSKIRVRPDREAFRIGYLRAGAIAQATTGEPVRTDDPRCRGGWYQLTTGGYVCNRRDVIAYWDRRPPQVAGDQPFGRTWRGEPTRRRDSLPYIYARNRGENTPMYRNLPTDEQAAEFEGFRIPGQEPPPQEAAAEGEGGEGGESPAAAAAEGATPTEEAVEEEPEPITLASLEGERDSILMRRMMRGFVVSLDRDFRAGPYRRRYWRTIHNGFIPYRLFAPIRPPSFRGVRLEGAEQLPMGFVPTRRASYYVPAGERLRRAGSVDFQHRVNIVGEREVGGREYYRGADGRFYRKDEVREIEVGSRPDEVGEHDTWIEVNLARQYLIAYEGDRPVYVTLISSGRPFHPDDPEANFLTPTGLFRIRAKHLAANMDGDTAADGPYSIDDVPYVMYFQLAYALHGAFWHRGFGFPRSHGCVNLAPRDAQWIFNWSEPRLPEGWHGIYPTDESPGTWIHIHGETPGQRD